MWEQLESGPTETFRAKVPGGWLYRVDCYVQLINSEGRELWDLRTSTLCFVHE